MGMTRRATLKTLAAGVFAPRQWCPSGTTWAMGTEAVVAGRRAVGLTIGVDQVDAKNYGGWKGMLDGAVNDMRDMEDLLKRQFHRIDKLEWNVLPLMDASATIGAVTDKILTAGQHLKGGDLLVITFAGNGGRLPDFTGEPSDGRDTTWCLHDGQVRLCELDRLFGTFAPDVKIVVISDASHPNHKVQRVADRAAATIVGVSVDDPKKSNLLQAFQHNVQLSGGDFATAKSRLLMQAKHIVDRKDDPDFPAFMTAEVLQRDLMIFREMPFAYTLPAFLAKRDYYDGITKSLPSMVNIRSKIRARVLKLVAAQADQLAIEVGGRGLFTSILASEWQKTKDLRQSYTQLRDNVASWMPDAQKPQLHSNPNPRFDDKSPELEKEPAFSVA